MNIDSRACAAEAANERSGMQKKVLVLIDDGGTAGLMLARQLAFAGTQCVIGCYSMRSTLIRELIRSLQWDDAVVVELARNARLCDSVEGLVQVAISEFGKLDAIVGSFDCVAAALPTGKAPAVLWAHANLYRMAAALAYLPSCSPGKIVELVIERSNDVIESSHIGNTGTQHVSEELLCYGIEVARIHVASCDNSYPGQKAILNAAVSRPDEVILPLSQGCMRAVAIALGQPVGIASNKATNRECALF